MRGWSLGSISLKAGLPRAGEGPVAVGPEGMTCSLLSWRPVCAAAPPPHLLRLSDISRPQEPSQSLTICTLGTTHVAREAPSS